jgi:GAF domain-containing protein
MSAPNGLRAATGTFGERASLNGVAGYPDLLSESAKAFCRMVLSNSTLDQALRLVAQQGLGLSPGTHAVVVSLPHKKGALVGLAGRGAVDVAQMQQVPDPSPSSDAVMQGATQEVGSLIVEKRWPDFTNSALYCGVQSLLCCPLKEGDRIVGSLSFYSSDEGTFGGPVTEIAQQFAGMAGVFLTNARSYEASTALAVQLNEALSSRAVIDQAKGILMATEGITADQAFDKIKSLSQHTNVKVRELCQRLVEGQPAGGPPIPARV